MFGNFKKYFSKETDEIPKITREDYDSAVSAMRSMEKDNLVEPGWNSYRKHALVVEEYNKQHPEEFR